MFRSEPGRNSVSAALSAPSRLAALLVASLAWAMVPHRAAAELGRGSLQIAGTRLTVSPESQTVPFDTPTILSTRLEGFDPSEGTLPPDLRVLADLTGPEIRGILTLETTPNEPLRVPALSIKGEYRVDNIRLLQGNQLLAFAQPSSASVLVTEVLVTRVQSRALTMDEIRSRGIVVSDSFKAYNFTFGFAVAGETFDYNVPVIWQPTREIAHFLGVESAGAGSARFAPPRMLPFVLNLAPDTGSGGASGGCTDPDGCDHDAVPPIPGVIVFPTDTRMLNQFFSIVLLAQNGAPAGDRLVIRDLTAKISLPPGLRAARTEPPTPLGVPVPVHVPGPDGKLGTADDITFLVAQATGQAEFLAEGLREGTHVVTIDLDGILEGLPAGLRHITGQARGAVVVRDPTLNVTITHPETVRTDEEYSLLLTLSNTSNAPANSLSVTLPPSQLTGAEVVGTNRQTIDTLLPGDSQVLEFRLRALRTGRVIASAVRSDAHVTPSFELTLGIGEAGIPLSPTSIILPRATSVFPAQLQRDALRLIGLGFSLATAPAQALRANLPQVDRATVDRRVEQLAETARAIDLGERPEIAAGSLLLDWLGARDGAWEWDKLRRTTPSGGLVQRDLAAMLAAPGGDPAEVAERLMADSFSQPPHLAAAADGGAQIRIRSRASGKATEENPLATRAQELPFADVLPVGSGQLALVGTLEPTGYELEVRVPSGGATSIECILPAERGQYERWSWSGVSLSAAGRALVTVGADAAEPVLRVDADGDGVFERQVPAATSALTQRPFLVVAAVQNVEADPSGHVVDVLFSGEVDRAGLDPADPDRFQIPDKISDGGRWALGSGVYASAASSRIVRVVFSNPLSPYRAQRLTVRDLRSATDQTLAETALDVETRTTMPGTLVAGRVIGPDGRPVPHAVVHLFETDYTNNPLVEDPCITHETAAVRTDDDGRFLFDYVRRTECGDLFQLRASDAANHSGEASGRVRFIGDTVQLDVVMLGRGGVRGHVAYADGTVPSSFEAQAFNPVFREGRAAHVTRDGSYEIGDLPVGSITVAARDGLGNAVAQSVEIAAAGAVVERDLVLPRRPAAPTGELRGFVVKPDGVTPVTQAYVALYVGGTLVGVRRSGTDGGFDFGVVPTGTAEIEAFSGETGVAGANFVFEIAADRVNAITVRLLDQRGTVRGHVYRRSLGGTAPLAGAVVYVNGLPFHTLSDADGAYEIDGVFAGNWIVTAADLAQGTTAVGQVTISADGEVALCDVYLQDKTLGSIGGEVLGFDGEPVAGATVHLRLDDQHWFREVLTDGAGKFLLPDLSPGTYEVHGIKGAAGAKAPVQIRFPGDVPFVSIRFKKGSVHGTVKARNESGATVGVKAVLSFKATVVRDGLVGLAYQSTDVETDAGGNYQLNGLLVGGYTLTAVNAFYGTRSLRDSLTYDGESQQRDFTFERNGAVRGVVYDYDGATPLAGAKVTLRHPAFADYTVQSDADGRFSFELVPPTLYGFAVEASINQGLLFRVARANLAPMRQGQNLDVQLTMLRQGTVSGQVQVAAGAPAAGATVTLTETQFPNRRLQVQTDGRGAFSFHNVFEGTTSIGALSLNGLGGRNTAVIAAEGEERTVLIQLQETGEIHGRLLSPVDGTPVASASIRLYRTGGGVFDAANSAGDGSFEFTVLPIGSYAIRALDYRTGRQGRAEDVVVGIDGQIVQIQVVLEARGAVSGRLLEPGSARPVPAATIRLDTGEGLTTFCSTDTDGGFEFAGVPQGRFYLFTREPDGRRTAAGRGEIVREGQNVQVDLVLEASGSVSGSVFSPKAGSSDLAPNVSIALWQSLTQIGGSIQNPFLFQGILASRPFYLEVTELGGLHHGSATGKLTSDGENASVDVKLWPIGSVSVTVGDAAGSPIANATVDLVSSGPYGGRFHATTDATGLVRFLNVGGGPFTAYATDPISQLAGAQAGSIDDEGLEAAVRVTLQPSARVSGRVLRAGGSGPADALGVLQLQGKTYYARTAADGGISYPAIPLGDFRLRLYEQGAPGYRQLLGASRSNGEIVNLGDVVLDDHDPFIVSVQPANGTTGVKLDAEVLLHFNEPLDPWGDQIANWAWLESVDANGTHRTLYADASFRDGNTTLALKPWAPLPNFTSVTVHVRRAYDVAGREMSGAPSTTFTTIDAVPPFVLESTPRQGAANVPTDAQIRVRFSESVMAESVGGAAMQLEDGATGDGLGTAEAFHADTHDVVLTPVTQLLEDHPYRLRIQGVRDLSGNAIVPYVLEFWTKDLTPPRVESIVPGEGTVVTAGDRVTVRAVATDNQHVARVDFSLQGTTSTSSGPNFTWDAIVQPVEAEQDVPLRAVAVDDGGNQAELVVHLHVKPLQDPTAPSLRVWCPGDGARLAPGTFLDVRGSANDNQALQKVEIFLDGAAVPIYSSPSHEFQYRVTAPSTAHDGDVIRLRIVATDYSAKTTQRSIEIPIVEGALLTGDFVLTTGNQAFEHRSLIVTGGTLTLEGHHALRDLLLLGTAKATHAVTATTAEFKLELDLDRDLYVGCDASLDAVNRGYRGGDPAWSYPNSRVEGAHGNASHGGRGKGYSTSNPEYDSLFDPRDSGAGSPIAPGGGVIRIAAQGSLSIDGLASAAAGAAGGSIRLQGQRVGGLGRVHAEGNNGSSGGRIALLGGVIADDFVDRAWAPGYHSGTAGTIYVRRGSQRYGDLIIDNGDNQYFEELEATELLPIGTGVITAASESSIVDAAADFRHGLDGARVTFGGDDAHEWRIVSNEHHGHALELDTTDAALPLSLVGQSYRGVYHFDNIILRHGAALWTHDRLVSEAPPQVAPGAHLLVGEYDTPDVGLSVSTAPGPGVSFRLTAAVASAYGIDNAHLEVTGAVTLSQTYRLYGYRGNEASWDLSVPQDPTSDGFTAHLEATDGRGHTGTRDLVIQWAPDRTAPTVSISGGPEVHAGEKYSLWLNSADDRGVRSTTLTVLGTTYTWEGGGVLMPELTAPATSVSLPTTAIYEAVDRAGNRARATLDLVVVPASLRIAEILPAEGSTVEAGSLIPLSARADSLSRVMKIELTADGRTYEGSGGVIAFNFLVPPTSVPVPLEIRVDAEDESGARVSATRTLQLVPPPASRPPVIAQHCPGDFAQALAGGSLPIHLEVEDDARVAQVEIWVADETVPRFLRRGYEVPLGRAGFDTVIDLATVVPADRPIPIRIRATDYGQQAVETLINVHLLTATPITALELGANDRSLEAQDVVVTGGMTVAGTHTFRSLSVLSGAIQGVASTATTSEELQIRVLGDAYVGCNARLTVAGLGYLGAPSPNERAYTYPNVPLGPSDGGGGRHEYGDLWHPSEPGEGGGSFSGAGANGGGVLNLTVDGDLHVDGTITANGDSHVSAGGGGAGGSIELHARSVDGVGAISADGGYAESSFYHISLPGGGGRVAVYADEIASALRSKVTARAGSFFNAGPYASAGTVFVATPPTALGDLSVVGGTSLTEIAGMGGGYVDSATPSSLTDLEARFTGSLRNHEVFLNENPSVSWPVVDIAPDGQTLQLQASPRPFVGVVGDFYRGLIRFDQLRVGEGARLVSAELILTGVPPVIDSTSSFQNGNLGGPILRPELLHLRAGIFGLDLAGDVGSVDDPEQPIEIRVLNPRTGAIYWGLAAEDGSFSMLVGGQLGDELLVTAFDDGVVSVPSATAKLSPIADEDFVQPEFEAPLAWIQRTAALGRTVALYGYTDQGPELIVLSLADPLHPQIAGIYDFVDEDFAIDDMILTPAAVVLASGGDLLWVHLDDPAHPRRDPERDTLHLVDADWFVGLERAHGELYAVTKNGEVFLVDAERQVVTAHRTLGSELGEIALDRDWLWSLTTRDDGDHLELFDLSSGTRAPTPALPASELGRSSLPGPLLAFRGRLLSQRMVRFGDGLVWNWLAGAPDSAVLRSGPDVYGQDAYEAAVELGDLVLMSPDWLGRFTGPGTEFEVQPLSPSQRPFSDGTLFFQAAGYLWTRSIGGATLQGHPSKSLRPWLDGALLHSTLSGTDGTLRGSAGCVLWRGDRVRVTRGSQSVEAVVASDGSFTVTLPGSRAGEPLDLQALDSAGAGGNIVRVWMGEP